MSGWMSHKRTFDDSEVRHLQPAGSTMEMAIDTVCQNGVTYEACSAVVFYRLRRKKWRESVIGCFSRPIPCIDSSFCLSMIVKADK